MQRFSLINYTKHVDTVLESISTNTKVNLVGYEASLTKIKSQNKINRQTKKNVPDYSLFAMFQNL